MATAGRENSITSLQIKIDENSQKRRGIANKTGLIELLSLAHGLMRSHHHRSSSARLFGDHCRYIHERPQDEAEGCQKSFLSFTKEAVSHASWDHQNRGSRLVKTLQAHC